jgi:hypothetical protein
VDVFVIDPVAMTVIMELPTGVDEFVVIVRVVVQVGVQVEEVKDPTAPVGNPEAVKLTPDAVAPAAKVDVIKLLTVKP